jgi:hypothetical protein
VVPVHPLAVVVVPLVEPLPPEREAAGRIEDVVVVDEPELDVLCVHPPPVVVVPLDEPLPPEREAAGRTEEDAVVGEPELDVLPVHPPVVVVPLVEPLEVLPLPVPPDTEAAGWTVVDTPGLRLASDTRSSSRSQDSGARRGCRLMVGPVRSQERMICRKMRLRRSITMVSGTIEFGRVLNRVWRERDRPG